MKGIGSLSMWLKLVSLFGIGFRLKLALSLNERNRIILDVVKTTLIVLC